MIWTMAVLSCVLSMAWPASGGLLTIVVLFVGGGLFLAWDKPVPTPREEDRPAGASVLSAVEKAEAQRQSDSE
jgi:hypothetical protein